jgi:hypothetical protein
MSGMPQINRIRVNNVKYNFGTQYYDDFMMRFSGKNTIYDLANGGGKSLLMLLLLQNMIPNCTLDEKQPIEKLFRGDSGNTAIHSLIEWNLEPCYQKEGFRYMLTGFCARKARDGETAEGARDTASIEYYNYCIFYRELGENDIKNLPLQKGDERITYQELRDYLRDLEKRDFGVSVRIFDRKGDYQAFISNYGIHESAWEIIRGINKTEGHVRTYFETNYRTGRKVVEDLLIEEIIQKSFANRFGADDEDARMAQTLLDIKDKLVELSKKHGQLHRYDEQIQAISDFSAQLGDFRDIFNDKERKQGELVGMLSAARERLGQVEQEITGTKTELAELEGRLFDEQKRIDTARVMEEQRSRAEVGKLNEEAYLEREAILKESARLRDDLAMLECLEEYAQYSQYMRQLGEINQIMENRLRDHEDITQEMRGLAAIRKERDDKALDEANERLGVLNGELEDARRQLSAGESLVMQKEKEAALVQGRRELLAEQVRSYEQQLGAALAKASLVVPEEAQKELDRLRDGIGEDRDRLAQARSTQEADRDAHGRRLGLKSQLEGELEWERSKIRAAGERLENSDAVSLASLEEVYGCKGAARLVKAIGDVLNGAALKARELEEDILGMETYVANLEHGRYECDGTEYHKLKAYLEEQYGEDVMTGTDWYATLNMGQRRDVLKRVPFLHYGFVIKNDFERIKEDTRLWEFNKGSYAIPIISENVIYDMKLEVNTELVVFSARNLSFLTDAGRLETEKRQWLEEIDAKRSELEHVNDRKDVISGDYEKAFEAMLRERSGDDPQTILDAALRRQSELEGQLKECDAAILGLEERIEAQGRLAAGLEESIAAAGERASACEEVVRIDHELGVAISARDEAAAQGKDIFDRLNEAREELEPARKLVKATAGRLAAAEAEIRRIRDRWQQYDTYHVAGENAPDGLLVDGTMAADLADDSLDARFFALKSIVEQDSRDITDKERLKAHYMQSMERCKRSIEYKGLDFERVREYAVENGGAGDIGEDGGARRIELRKELEGYDERLRQVADRLDSQSAMYNRLDGSISHGISQIEERYGSFEEFECESPSAFIEQHKALVARLKGDKKQLTEALGTVNGERTGLELCVRDMERIIRKSGLEELAAQPVENADYTSYEEVQGQLEAIMRRESRRREAFAREKRELAARLRSLGGEELADEVEKSLEAPLDAEGCDTLISRLEETNSYIGYEKERISEGIRDMERIKESFENRCIQTCCNIKTELDRLPQLSTINMDGEVIRIIGLSVPYVREEQYHERMSSYIDETVTAAESFATEADRLAFIRNRLAWKRMFSVIVTDMNGIKVNLYKRERIKDQSRYLRYEEAVGSTGQSQGIYIQFLIGIINYITNVNAPAREAAALGKTIFIDNPFGAAKDTYIWEPIFKLLETNHVQLIVPARGATPAITGRFDVNYILGQKLVDSRQQTVVVDYHSRVERNELEYERLEYEQQTLKVF